MATIVDKTACEAAGQGQEAGLLPISPFTALQFHYGMLLGVDDLDTGQAYSRGKIRLHNAWLHREGVVWGLNVAFNQRNELTVDPGLALDAAGHELHLDRQACLDLGKWYAAHKDDQNFNFEDVDGGGKQFSVHVVAKFTACLTRPVPAIVEPCAGAQTDTAFSRVFETVELLLRPELSTPKDRGYHRLRILFQLEDNADPKYADVLTRRQTIQALPNAQQPPKFLAALREFAALDEIDLQPQPATQTEPASIFPEDPTEVVLADIFDVVVMPTAAGDWVIAAPVPTPNVTVRPSHIATATIQELLCGPLFTNVAGPAAAPPLSPAAPTGPTVTSAHLAARSVRFTTSRPIAAATLKPAAFAVTGYSESDGWSEIAVRAITPQNGSSIRIDFTESPAGNYVRLIIRGTGPTPLLAADDNLPLGAHGAGGSDDGVDYVKMFKRS
jgi:hypothetical protein